ncbi:hypothetical protein R75465_04741 [Paraburkholderia aspalathi]|uniref:hypothetical protein n=1 Tax=Paraburkholderia aspalathi TaxID=1324617 RepID=UPI001B207C70|nr:hypothetical protein [Paraburkholderia aspalathi]CAE6796503.1 hypothetical protein R75465_04741 [Paraburkholderia aspalathi]
MVNQSLKLVRIGARGSLGIRAIDRSMIVADPKRHFMDARDALGDPLAGRGYHRNPSR